MIGIFMVASASASDLNESDVNSVEVDEVVEITEDNVDISISNNDLEVNDSSVNELSAIEDNEVIGTTYSPNTFAELQNAVNNAKSGDTISVSGTYVFTSTLSPQVSINFIGKNSATFDGNNNVALFMNIYAPMGVNIYFKDITFKNGNALQSSGSYAGAIHSYSCTVENCYFINNRGIRGGAISGGFTITGCTFEGNTAQSRYGNQGFGGACYDEDYYGSTITNSIFRNNHADYGGAVYGSYKSIISGSTFESNSANYEGGAIYTPFLTLNNCNFNGNSANSYGAAYCIDGQGTGSTFSNNVANSIQNSISFMTVNNNLELDLNQKGVFNVKLYDFSGPIKNKDITFTFKDGKTVTKTTDSNGAVNYELYFTTSYVNKGKNKVDIKFGGESGYSAISSSSQVVVHYQSSMRLKDLSKEGKEGHIRAYLYDSDGVLANKSISFKVNDIIWSSNSDEQGQAVFNIKDFFTDLEEYEVNVGYEGDGYNYGVSDSINAILTKYDSILNVDDLSIILDDEKLINVTLSNVKGVVANQIITFNVSGVQDVRTTNKYGVATFSLNDVLTHVGKYQVELSFAGDNLNNPSSTVVNVQINSYEGNLTVVQNGRYYNDTFLTFNLLNSRNNSSVANASIDVVFSNGEKINLTTDSMGNANIKVNFTPGTYGLAARVTDENVNVNSVELDDIQINEIDGVIELSQEGSDYNNSTLIVRLVNNDTGDVYRNIRVKLEFITNGVTDYVVTGDDGIARYDIPFEKGTYYVLASISEEYTNFANVEKEDIRIEKSASKVSGQDIVFDYGGVGHTFLTVVGCNVGLGNISVVDHEANITLIGNEVIISDLDVGNYTLQIITTPDDNYVSVTDTSISITVNKVNSTVSAGNFDFIYGTSGSTALTLTGCKVTLEQISVIGHDEAIISFSTNNVVSVSNLSVGTYHLQVNTTPDIRHLPVTKLIEFTVIRADSSVMGNDVVFDYESSGNTTLTVLGGNVVESNISVVGHSEAKISLRDNVVHISNLDAGRYTLQVITTPDFNHTSVTDTSINVTVNKIDSSVSGNNFNFNFGATGSTVLNLVGCSVVKGNISVINHKANVDIIDNRVYVSGLSAGDYRLQVITTPTKNYKSTKAFIDFTVNKVDADFSFGSTISFSVNGIGSTNVIDIVGGRFDLSAISVVEHDDAIITYDDKSKTISVSGLDEGTYILSVTIIPDENHNPVTRTNSITVTPFKKSDSKISFSSTNIVFDYAGSGFTIATVVGGTIDLSVISVDNHPEAKISLAGNKITVSGLGVGSYTLRVKTIPFDNYISVTETVSVTVNRVFAAIKVEKSTVILKKGTMWKLTIVDSKTGKPISNMKLTLKVFSGKKYTTKPLTTNAKGEATYQTKGLSKGNHKVVVSGKHPGYKFNTFTSSINVIKQTSLKFKLKQKVDDNGGSLRSYLVLNKKTKKGVNGVKVKVLIYTGKKYKTYTFKTKKIKGKKGTYNGAFGFATNKFSVGKHKVKIMPASIKYKGSTKTTIKITKKARNGPKFMREV